MPGPPGQGCYPWDCSRCYVGAIMVPCQGVDKCQREQWFTLVYIDGFNLYFGMRDSSWKRYYWLDIGRFGRGLATGDREVVGVKYFTARVAAPPDQFQRQVTFLEANQTVGGCKMYFGRYQQDPYQCRHCGTRSVASHEKATDCVPDTNHCGLGRR
jgi:hypothetical protein